MGVIQNSETRFEASIRSWLAGFLLSVFGVLFTALGVTALGAGEAQGGILVAVGLGMIGLGVWLLSRRTHILLDRETGTATIRFARLFGRRDLTLPLASITRAQVLRRRTSGNRLYKLVLQVSGGEHSGTHSLTGGYSSGGWRKGRMARAINAWLGVED
ncbi:hypothetical protein SAMN05216376_10679 [Mameliella alba]|uniref:hypothetical protein n=1 Tax=Mameliella alba TaxID=561184 RepID=UPI0008826EA1|nr:hypothetical protein [Mameliella alba]OWV47792.1 hypothetical protein CDZ96_11870 [Mameliella alba]PTR39824.1 hypothetical protein LX94_02199 [Mameliella alba]GGF61222.1 hypothetical protein GCM10011319_22910 [Mameliella alba]SDD11196.1 hypothetical protein SAMN05216376_10679 [Mameliella alba]